MRDSTTEELEHIKSKFKLTGNGVLVRITTGKPVGSPDSKGYLRVRVNNRYHGVHQIAWFLTYGQWPKNHIDHINGVVDDNRIENLREVTHAQNMRGFQKAWGKSEYRGVHWHKNRNKWAVGVRKNGKMHHVGYFNNEKEAAIAYNKKATELGFFPEALNEVNN